MNNQNTPSPPKKSLLQSIISFTKSDDNFEPDISKKPKNQKISPVRPWSIWRDIKAAFFVVGIFYILLCVFILVNPWFALFFNNVFGIEYITVQFTLEYTIYVFYSILGIVLGVSFLFFWYRSILIKTKKKYKKIVLWLLTATFGSLFFANIALFAWTYNRFLAIDFTNIAQRVILYDNVLLWYKNKLRKGDDWTFFRVPNKIIWPITIRYDISPQIKRIVRENGLLLDRWYSFEIDYDGDGNPDAWSSDSPRVHLPISHAESSVLVPQMFKEVGQYKTTAFIRALDSSGNRKEIPVEMPEIIVQNVVNISRTEWKDGSKSYLFDASSLSNLWQAHWSIIGQPDIKFVWYQFSPKDILQYPAVVCLKMQPIDIWATDPCDWRYVIDENIQTNITDTNIQTKIDPLNPLKYQFSVNPRTLQGEIKTIRWKIDGKTYDGPFLSGTETVLDYTFKKSWTYLIHVEIEDTLWNILSTSPESIFTALFTELKSGYGLKILDENDNDIWKNTYILNTKTFFLPEISVPTTLTLDAVGIQSINPRLKLSQVEWDLDNNGVYERSGSKIQQTVSFPQQYVWYARYVFEDKTIDGELKTQMYIDKIVLKWVEKPIDVRLKIRPDRDYAPALVRIDATGSRVQKGEIFKFLYDFGDGSPVYEWEGIVDYRYKNPWEYTIQVTAVTKDGQKDSYKQTLIIKKPQEFVTIQPSVASENAKAGYPITFDITSQGDVASVSWNFGDNTPKTEWFNVIHTFREPGIYTITAHAVFDSGIEKISTLSYQVK